MPSMHELYDAWVMSDHNWMVELEAAHPKEWPGDNRYNARGEGEPGTKLRDAHDAFVAAKAAFYAAGGPAWLQGEKRDQYRDEIQTSGSC